MHRLRAAFPFLALCLASGLPPSAGTSVAAPGGGGDKPASKEVTTKHALLVGCTLYPNLKSLKALEGPGNDVVLMRQVLKDKFSFLDSNIVTLAEAAPGDNRPTRANIKREFDRLARVAKKGDQVVILLGGHGSQQPDQEPFDEPDGLDEIFLPADSGPWLEDKKAVANAIIDDELAVWTKAITDTGASLCVIVDSCHSGTILRGDSPEVAREVPAEDIIPRSALESARSDAAKRSKAKDAPAVSAWEEAPGLVALYAAQPDEPTVERRPYDGSSDKKYGLFTYTLCQVLTSSRSPMTYKELAQRIHAEYVRHNRTAPTPLIEGKEQDREVLGLRTWPGRSRYLLVKEGGGWKVNAGGLHGLTEKSILAVYPPAGDAKAAKPVGHVVIRTSNVTDSVVVPCAYGGIEAPNDLPRGGRCEPVFIDYGSLNMSVAVDGDSAEARGLKKQLQALADEKASLLALVADPGKADWVFQIDKGKAYLVPASAALAITKLPKTTPRFGPFALDDAVKLKTILEQIARGRNLLKLTAGASEEAARSTTPAGEESDALDVDVAILKLKSKTDREGTPISWKTRGTVLRPGDWVAFRVQNKSRFAVDVTLLFVDSAFGIHPVFPKPGLTVDNRFGPGQKYTTRAFPVTADTLGLEHVVLIAVRGEGQPVDFTCLSQPSLDKAATRGNAPQTLRSPLGQLLTGAMYGQGATRGLGAAEVDNHTLRLLSWHVEQAKK